MMVHEHNVSLAASTMMSSKRFERLVRTLLASFCRPQFLIRFRTMTQNLPQVLALINRRRFFPVLAHNNLCILRVARVTLHAFDMKVNHTSYGETYYTSDYLTQVYCGMILQGMKW